MNSRLLAVVATGLVVGAFGATPTHAAGPAAVATAGPAAPVATGVVPQTQWEALIPKEWDPTKRFRDSNLGALSDSNPKVLQMMREMRETWDNAPTNDKMDGASVRLPGYVVPLDEVNGQMKEFLLVPYFGACVHTPPPPANQIVHVITGEPMKNFRMMDAVWVTGTLKTTRLDTAMGTSGYQIVAPRVERYVEPVRR